MAYLLEQNGNPPGCRPLNYDAALHSTEPVGKK
jgi:hypothetical protein